MSTTSRRLGAPTSLMLSFDSALQSATSSYNRLKMQKSRRQLSTRERLITSLNSFSQLSQAPRIRELSLWKFSCYRSTSWSWTTFPTGLNLNKLQTSGLSVVSFGWNILETLILLYFLRGFSGQFKQVDSEGNCPSVENLLLGLKQLSLPVFDPYLTRKPDSLRGCSSLRGKLRLDLEPDSAPQPFSVLISENLEEPLLKPDCRFDLMTEDLVLPPSSEVITSIQSNLLGGLSLSSSS